MDDGFGVARCPEGVAALFELAPQLAVVVDLAVEHHPDGAVFVANRLLAGLEVDDAQPAHAEPDAVAEVEPSSSGPRWTIARTWRGFRSRAPALRPI